MMKHCFLFFHKKLKPVFLAKIALPRQHVSGVKMGPILGAWGLPSMSESRIFGLWHHDVIEEIQPSGFFTVYHLCSTNASKLCQTVLITSLGAANAQ